MAAAADMPMDLTTCVAPANDCGCCNCILNEEACRMIGDVNDPTSLAAMILDSGDETPKDGFDLSGTAPAATTCFVVNNSGGGGIVNNSEGGGSVKSEVCGTLSVTPNNSVVSSPMSSVGTAGELADSPCCSRDGPWSPGGVTSTTTSIVVDPALVPANKAQDPLKPPFGGDGGDQSKDRLSVIAKHKKMGPKSLNLFKEEVKRYATEHTFKVNRTLLYMVMDSPGKQRFWHCHAQLSNLK